MAMRIFTPGEFFDELHKRGCEPTDHVIGDLRFWRTNDGHLHFQVAEPHAMGHAYADWYLDYLIQAFNLPAAPIN